MQLFQLSKEPLESLAIGIEESELSHGVIESTERGTENEEVIVIESLQPLRLATYYQGVRNSVTYYILRIDCYAGYLFYTS